MRQIPIDMVRSGMVLGRTVLNARGDVLLRAGTELNERYLDVLRSRGYPAVLIADPATDDVQLGDVLSERVRQAVTAELCQLYVGAPEADERQLAENLARLREGMVAMVEEVMSGNALVALQAMRARDTYYFEHAIDGTIVALLIARRVGYDRRALQRLAAGCLTRDIGMAKIPTDSVNHPGPLGPQEWSMVRHHTTAGYSLLRRLRPGAVVPNAVALQHHERQDGLGYPQGLRGTNKISLDAAGQGRIILDAEIAAVADVYDALGADRPHRRALAPDRIVVEMQRLSGGHLNRGLVGQLLAILPVFPVGTEVLLRSGPHRGYHGIVVAVAADDLARPVVRLIADRDGRRIAPFEIDLRSERTVLAAIVHGEAALARATA